METVLPREILTPVSEQEWLELRTKDITSTEVAALFGASPYTTRYELWHRKRDGKVVSFEANERMKWGTRLQSAIAHGIAEDQGWKVREMKEYIRLPEARTGSSFDYEYETAAGNKGILEVKNVDSLAYRDGWLVEGNHVEAPPHIEFQAQHQLLTSGHAESHIGALIGGNTVSLLRRVPDLKVFAAIKAKIAEFWKSVDEGIEPAPDFHRDAEFIISQFGFSEPGKIIQADETLIPLAEQYMAAGRDEKRAKEEKEALKAQMLTMIGDAEKVVSVGFSISAGMIGPKHVEYDAEGYRNFRITPKKAKP